MFAIRRTNCNIVLLLHIYTYIYLIKVFLYLNLSIRNTNEYIMLSPSSILCIYMYHTLVTTNT